MRPPLPRLLPAALAALGLLAAPASRADDDEEDGGPPRAPVEVYEWSVWVGSPAQTSLNATRAYRNAMPGVVGTSRTKAEEGADDRRFPIAPISVVQVFGEPTADIDIDVRVEKGTILSHWPRGNDRGGRIQWFETNLIDAPPKGIPLGFLPEDHWLQALRRVKSSLFLDHESRVERFLAFDAELTMPAPIKLRGGPDEYTLQNLTPSRLLDIAIIAPTETGYRVGWIDELPAAVPDVGEEEDESRDVKPTDDEKALAILEDAEADANASDDDEATRAKPLPVEGDADVLARVDQILNRPVNVAVDEAPRREVLELIAGQARFRYELDDPALAEAETNLAAPVSLQAPRIAARDALAEVIGPAGLSYRVTEEGSLFITTSARLAEDAEKAGVVIEGPPITLTLSQPLPATDPSYRELTLDSLSRRLADRGMRLEVLDLLLDQYGSALFEPGELIVLSHLPRPTIEDAVLLDVFPTPRKLVRTALVVVHGIDPRLQDRARDLVRRLGDDAPDAREEAESQLFALGPVAVPALEDALRDKDLEVVFRAERLLLQLNRPVP